MNDDDTGEYEYAMLKWPDGSPVQRSAALRSLARFLEARRKAGGTPPLDSRGQPLVWRENNVWVPQSAPGRTGRTPLKDAVRRQEQVVRELEEDAAVREGRTPLGRRLQAERQARLDDERRVAERREAEAVRAYAEASASAVEFMRLFVLGRAVGPHPSMDECVGRQLALAYPVGPSLAARQAREARLGR
jgi:hypothetical protein